MLVVGKLYLGRQAKMSVETHSVEASSRHVREAWRSIRLFGQTAHVTPACRDTRREWMRKGKAMPRHDRSESSPRPMRVMRRRIPRETGVPTCRLERESQCDRLWGSYHA